MEVIKDGIISYSICNYQNWKVRYQKVQILIMENRNID